MIRRSARVILPVAKKKGCVTLIGAIFQRGLATAQPEFLDNPPPWMTPDLVQSYRRILQLQQDSGMSLAELGVRYMAAQADIDTIIGAKLPSEIEECVQAAEKGPLPDDMLQKIEEVV